MSAFRKSNWLVSAICVKFGVWRNRLGAAYPKRVGGMTIADRLRELIGNGSVNGFAKTCGLPTPTVRQYLSGSVPGADKAAQIAERTGVSLQWLVTGIGPKTVQTPSEGTLPDPELLGRVVDRIARVYREAGVKLSEMDKGRLAAERYIEIASGAGGHEEWPALLDLMEVRIRKTLFAAAAAPGQTKREVS